METKIKKEVVIYSKDIVIKTTKVTDAEGNNEVIVTISGSHYLDITFQLPTSTARELVRAIEGVIY